MISLGRIAKFERDYSYGGSFIFWGMIVLAVGILCLIVNNSRLDYPEIDAEVTGAELQHEADPEDKADTDTYRLNIRYTVDGVEYETVYENGPMREVGDTIKIDYDPSDPSKIGTHTAAWFPYLIIAAGVVAIIGGIISIIRNYEKNRRLKEQEEEWSNGQNL